jgi:hypothetical protein
VQYSTEVLRQPTDSKRSVLLWGASIVSAHFAVVLWHLLVLVRFQPDFPLLGGLALVLINLLPIAGVVAFAKGAKKLAASLIVVPLGVALVIGGYSHFLSPGSDNVLRMPSGGLSLEMQISAALLAVLEALGCWLGVNMLSRRHA